MSMTNIFEKIVEQKIQEAMRNGEFDNLPTKGKPVNLEEWASLPEDVRVGYMLLKNAGYAPAEVYVLKEIGELKERLSRSNNQDEEKKIRIKLEDVKLKYNLLKRK